MEEIEDLGFWEGRRDYTIDDQILKYKGKLVVQVKERRFEILQQFHNSLVGGHNGVKKTLIRIKSLYH